MPYLKIQTNLPLSKKAERTILRTDSTLVAEELERAGLLDQVREGVFL